MCRQLKYGKAMSEYVCVAEAMELVTPSGLPCYFRPVHQHVPFPADIFNGGLVARLLPCGYRLLGCVCECKCVFVQRSLLCLGAVSIE